MEYIELGICLVPMKWRFVRFSTLVAAQIYNCKGTSGEDKLKAWSILTQTHGLQPNQHVTHAHTRAVGVAV